MHILLSIIGIVGALSYYLFVLRNTKTMATEAIDVAQRVRGKMRRNAFRKKAEGSVLTSVDDPATAAAILLMKIAENNGKVPSDIRQEIENILEQEIGVADANETARFAEWTANQSKNSGSVLRAFKPLWISALTSTQRADFVEMAQRIADLDGGADLKQTATISQMKLHLLR